MLSSRWITTSLAGTLLLLASACHKEEKKEETEAPAPVQVTAVTQDTIRRIVRGDGVLFPRDQASISPKLAAPVAKFYVNRGDHVKPGQLLATLENRDLIASANEARGALVQAESNLRTIQGATVPEAVVKAQTDVEAARQARDAAKKVLDSRQELYEEQALARRQVEESRVSFAQADATYRSAVEHLRTLQSVSKEEQIKSAQGQVEAARAHLQSLEAQVAYSQIRSPIAGVVSDRPLYAGELANPGTALLTVIDISSVVARVNVPQAEATPVRVGQPAAVTQTDSDVELNGKVSVVSPATDPSTTTVQVWVQADNPGERLKPGASVHAAIATEIYKAATVVPAAAILPGEEGGTAVLTVSADSRAHKRPVKLGIREGNKVQVLSGVSPGESVVVVGGMGVDDKAKVKIVDTSVKEIEEDEDEKGGDDQKKEEAKPKAGK
jgi:multidrug efflux pump subunit AcrA (membrane-fusion protein)